MSGNIYFNGDGIMQTVRNKQNQLIEFNEIHVRGSVYKDELVLRVDDKIACFMVDDMEQIALHLLALVETARNREANNGQI